jgi:hypothetical protein
MLRFPFWFMGDVLPDGQAEYHQTTLEDAEVLGRPDLWAGYNRPAWWHHVKRERAHSVGRCAAATPIMGLPVGVRRSFDLEPWDTLGVAPRR